MKVQITSNDIASIIIAFHFTQLTIVKNEEKKINKHTLNLRDIRRT